MAAVPDEASAPLPSRRPRAVALWLARRGDQVLVFEGVDRVKPETYYRPLGGGVEYGELSRDALVREIGEELGIELVEPRLLATLENVFTLEDELRHEIVFLYEAEPADASFYARDAPEATEANGDRIHTLWLPLDRVRAGAATLYPSGLLEVLDSTGP